MADDRVAGHESLIGKLLIAEPTMPDANFHRSVIVLLEHSPEGALGLVLDRPTDTAVAEVLPAWAPYVSEPGAVFSGGPVSPEIAICLAQRNTVDDVVGWQPVLGTVGTLDVNRSPTDAPDDLVALRVFSGYSGWTGGQLEGELEVGAWFVVDRIDADLFTHDPGELWREVLRRQRGRLSTVAHYPPDPSLN